MQTGTQQTRVILVAEDDEDVRRVVSTALSAVGYSVLEAIDGSHAMQLLDERLPDLAVLDVGMPGFTGIEVCQKIKSDNQGELTPVIMLTALDSVKDKVKALEGGADDYLTKPFNLQELRARIKALLRVRDLNLSLRDKNKELRAIQEKLIEQERQLLVVQFAGTAAHSLGQPLSAIMLNCHLIENLEKSDPKYKKALEAIKQDIRQMADMIEKLKRVDASKTAEYYGSTDILDILTIKVPKG